MAIFQKNNQFHLRTEKTSYVICIYQEKYPVHLYWGERLCSHADLTYFCDETVTDRSAGTHAVVNEEKHLFLDDLPLEFSVIGNGLYKTPTFHARRSDGSTVFDFSYDGYTIYHGKKKPFGLPYVYTESQDKVETLEIYLKDASAGIKVALCYSVFEDYDTITRSIRYENNSNTLIEILSAQSAAVDFYLPDAKLLHLSGDWMREGKTELSPINHERICIDSKHGSSSALAQPFVALLESNADERHGNVYGFSLVYSGSFQFEAERGCAGQIRICAGISSFDFCWQLNPDDFFQTPEVVLIHSGNGIGEMSRRFHKIYRERLCRGKFRDQIRPIVINHWDATGTNFTEDQLIKIAKVGAESGMELFVLDDGWFGACPDGVRPLGDWFCNVKKLPNGLFSLVQSVNRLGMKFGIWFEPEIVSPRSELFRSHPDWCMQAPNGKHTQMYHQLILDLSRKEVQNYIVNSVSAVLDSANIEYVKWDYNRTIVETSHQMQRHQYILGLYQVLERLTEKYPEVLFEGCSSGGGRYDPGMLYYMPQTWASDNQRAHARLKTQYGMSLVYPAISMTAHAGQIEIGKTHHNDEYHTSALTAMSANFGFELDLQKLSDFEREQTRQYISLHHKICRIVQFGMQYRHGNPFRGENYAVSYVYEHRVVLFTYQNGTQVNGEEWRVFLQGLDTDGNYMCDGKKYTGELLMQLGLRIPLTRVRDQANCFIFEKIS